MGQDHVRLGQDIARLKAKQYEFPAAFEAARKDRQLAARNVKDTAALVKESENTMMFLVRAELDPDTKKAKFTNAEGRESEVQRRLATSPEHQRLVAESRAAELDHENAVNAFSRVEDEHRGHGRIIDLTIAEVNLLIHQ